MAGPVPLLIAAGTVALIVVAISVRRAFVVAQPDEWLLCIRNGRLVRAGIGIRLFRLPGDVVARFTSTVQRVSFKVGALSRERLRVSVDGFILWSVSPEKDGPFRAFQKLGLANLDAPPEELRSPKHLLTSPQHHAFQQLLGAEVQRLLATRSVDDLLLRQDAVVSDLRTQLAGFEEEKGIHIDDVQVLQLRPADEELLREMSAEVEQGVREEAENVRVEAAERSKRRLIESEARIEQERAEARCQELDREKALRLAQIAHDREVKLRQQEVEREEALAAEARAMEVAKAALAREELQLAGRLDRTRLEAEASRDAIVAVASAEERKSQGVRDYELARLATEKVGDALKELPLQEARWITMGSDTPAGSLAALVAAVRELALKPPRAA